ncbi:S1 RNA-binding domain-containing protein [Candidatus Beckwithbacteria bacterium]|nr:S1 RNA-binding domain-containing protein [Candidatus Beckwithbacteria bacterium]
MPKKTSAKTAKTQKKEEQVELKAKAKPVKTEKTEKASKKTTVKKPVKTEEPAVEDGKKAASPSENKTNETLARVVIADSLQEAKKKQPLKELKKQPDSMEELLEQTGYQIVGLKKGQEVAATISDKNKKSVFFDIGAKTEGILVEREMEWVEDYINFLNVGDTVLATVVAPENDKGQILLSLLKAANDWKWKLFEKYMETGEEVEVRGLDINKGGMIARLMNVRGFIPVSQFGRQWVGKLDQLYNKVFKAKVIEVDREKNRLIFSEKAVSESDILDKQQELLSEVKVGGTYKGQVSGVMPFGIFVRVILDEKNKDAGFLDGLVHISEISWEKVNDVAKLYKVGDVIDVQVMDIDQNTGKLNLSVKRLSDDPWEQIATNYPVDSKAKGTVTRLAAFGAFVEIEKGIEGLIHISKIPSDLDIKVGDKVDVYIESLDKQNHRISLGVVLSAKPVGYK